MKKKVYLIALLMVALAAGPGLQAAEPICVFHEDSLSLAVDYHFGYPGMNSLNINESLSLPFITLYIKADNRLSKSDFFTPPEDRIFLASLPGELCASRDHVSGINDDYAPSPAQTMTPISSPVYDIQYTNHDDERYAIITILPVVVSDDNELIFIKSLYANDALKMQSIKDKHEMIKDMIESAPVSTPSIVNRGSSLSGIPLGFDYVIITVESLVPVFQELAEYKISCGYSSAVVTVDSIIQNYSGLDDPAKIRNYLKDFYAAGGRYILLGGDEVLVPARYVYYYDTDYPVSTTYLLRPSNLYYADLDGEWDKDNDGIWGEPTDDAPDIHPELMVGRLPLKTAEAAQNYIDKLIIYETNPGNGNFDYLTRSLFFSSDEMRDYPDEGQHGYIAAALPPQITIDTVTAVEAPSGDAPSPTSADGLVGVDKISDGFGLIHILAHGRKDGFIVRSANYANWPASLILSTPQANNGHGTMLNLDSNQMTSLYYSLACDGGAFDLDSTDGESASWSLAEGLIAQPASGAVGLIANARWGWVYSSYLMQEKFTEYLYGLAEGSPVLAMYYSWLDYPSYRDLIFGQNYLGDPTLRIYREIPAKTELSLESTMDAIRLNVTANSDPLSDADIVISADGEIVEYGTTDENGEYVIGMSMENNVVYTITARHSGCTLVRESFTPSISLDIDDTENILPDSYSLEQNYPNPFNPSTVISWNLPQRSDVTLDIYNILGQLVDRYDFAGQSSGCHSITWYGTGRDGNPVASGIYFYRLVTPEYQETKKMYLIK